MTDPTRLLERLAETFPDRPAPLPDLVAAAHAGRRRRTRRTVALAAGTCVLAVGAGATLQQVLPDGGARRSDRVADSREVCDKNNPVPPKEPVPRGPDYPTNAAGQTYGAGSGGQGPDLVAAVGDCGRTGYIDPTDLDPPPWVPGAGTPRSTPVYEADGVTQIDTFTESPGTTVADGVTDPPAQTDGPDAVDVQGEWSAIIAGISAGGQDQYDTFRDLDLTIGFDGDDVRVYDGCRTWAAGFTLTDGELALTSPFAAESDVQCKRAAPLPQVLDNVRHVSESGRRTYLHLANFRIVVALTRS